ncbi:porin [Paraburkholderia sediminicola]|uniref:porin n=1 Tax=Paraburkholderia sediminicola TaxID=458836 RepID=UPI0038BC786F
MKKRHLAVPLLCAAAGVAHAQSSVTLYGIISVGMEAVNNAGGKFNYQMLSGALQPSRFGFRIREDLGGQSAVVADLENGFDSINGTLGQGGRLFGRQAWVGLSNPTWGTLTIGRQYDTFWDYFTTVATAIGTIGLLDHPGDADNLIGTWRYSNSVKYMTPQFHGLDAEGLYAFSNEAGAFGVNRAYSAGVRYQSGRLRIAAAYVELDRPGTVNAGGAVSNDYAGAPFLLFRSSPLNPSVGVRRQRNYGVGGYYDFGNGLRWAAMVDQVRFDYLDQSSFALTNYDTSFSYNLTPSLFLVGAYIYSHGQYGGINAGSHWNTAAISLDYYLSQRTDISLTDNFQRASGARAQAAFYLNAPSTNGTQNSVMLGMRHKF